MDLQFRLITLLKQRIGKDEALGTVLSDILFISTDAAYRRVRGETAFSIYELERISRHFNLSIDNLFNFSQTQVLFDYQPLKNFSINMNSYFSSISDYLQMLRNQENPRLIISINNTPFFQLFNFPELVHFKLYFWAKTHLKMNEIQDVKYGKQQFPVEAFKVGQRILRKYNSIPSVEIYDPELLMGFARELFYYYNSNEFEDPFYVLELFDQMLSFIEHLREQAKVGKKFGVGKRPPANGCELEMVHNETLNSITSFYYSTKQSSGLFLAHNFMNSLHTVNNAYVKDSKQILDCLISNSVKISTGNERGLSMYFNPLIKVINNYKSRILLDLEK